MFIAQRLVGLQMIQIEHDIAKNPNYMYLEANQLAIYKNSQVK